VSDAWDEYCGRAIAVRNSALAEAGDVFEALGLAQVLATDALMDGRVVYTDHLGNAQRNLLECFYFWELLTQFPNASLPGARRQFCRALKMYRLLREQERAGIAGRLGDAA
jgi:hypothetical protein